jgi:hypothetical protein
LTNANTCLMDDCGFNRAAAQCPSIIPIPSARAGPS